MEHIVSVLNNDCIEEYAGACGSQIMLAAKAHQENITDIEMFIWHMCVSYRDLNRITRLFEYLILWRDDAISNFNWDHVLFRSSQWIPINITIKLVSF